MKIGGGEKGKEQGAWSKEAVLSPQLAGGRDSILRSHSLTLLQGPLAWCAAESVVELSSPPTKGFLLVVGGGHQQRPGRWPSVLTTSEDFYL